VRERLLLVLPAGELHEFVCAKCSTSLGKRTVTGPTLTQVRPGQLPHSGKPRRLLR
jgi:hypothetical protein